MSGPFENREQAMAAVRPYASVFGPADYQAGTARQAQEALLLDACHKAGVELGAYDRRLVDWLIGMLDWSQIAVFVGLIDRAYAAGRTATS